MATPIPVNPVPLPVGDPIAVARQPFKGSTLADVARYLRAQDSQGFITQTWQRFLSQQQLTITASPTLVALTSLTDQSASIGLTDISGAILDAGTYEVWATTMIVQAAGVNSSIKVTFNYTHRSETGVLVGSADTSNSLGSSTSTGGLITIDNASPVQFLTTYASGGAPAMLHDLTVMLRRVQA